MISLALGIAVASALAAAGLGKRRSTRRAQRWVEAARTCGLQDLRTQEAFGLLSEVTGRKGDVHVKIERSSEGRSGRGTRVRAWPLDAVAPLTVRVEGLGTALRWSLGGHTEIELGDPTFDRRFFIEGPPSLALAVLDAPTRQLLWSVMSGRTAVQGSSRPQSVESQARLAKGVLTVDFPDSLGASRVDAGLAGLLATILDLALNLARPRDVPRQLAGNALRDPLWAVRLANLRVLARECSTHPETARLLRAACSDLSEEVRLTAALALGSDGVDTLERLAFEAAPDPISARAIVALGRRLPADRAVRALDDALAHGRVETACAFMGSLDRDDGGAEAERTLLRALGHAHPRVRAAAAQALGRVATVAAVLPLKQAAGRFGDLRGASRQAVAEIQARAVGARPGQLSLSGAGGQGNVSLTDDAGGHVSLPEERRKG